MVSEEGRSAAQAEHPDERPLPVGISGRLVALPLTNAAGDHALLLREGTTSRALVTGERQAERDRVVVVPLDDDVELRVDGDALAIWLATGSTGRPEVRVPLWANAAGYLLVILVLVFTVLGSMTFFSWLVGVLT
jgi:hypothetical protein